MLKVLCADCWEMELCSKILCADYARLGFYYARHYAQHYARAAFIMRDIMRGACNTAIHYARIMRACVLLCAALCATLCADSSHYARNAYSALCPPWLSTPPPEAQISPTFGTSAKWVVLAPKGVSAESKGNQYVFAPEL